MAKHRNSQSTRQPRNRTAAQTQPNRQRDRATGNGNQSRRTTPTTKSVHEELTRLRDKVNGLPTSDQIDQRVKREVNRELSELIVDFNIARTEGIGSEQLVAFAVKLRTIDEQLTLLAERVTVVENDVEELKGNHESLAARIATLEQTIDPATFQGALEAGSVGGKRSFIDALRSRNVDDATIARVIGVLEPDVADMDLSDTELFAHWFEAYGSFKADTLRRLDSHNDRLDEHDVQIGSHSETIEQLLRGQTAIAETVGNHTDTLDDHERRLLGLERDTPVLVGLAVTALVALAIWLLDLCKGWFWYNELGIALFIGLIAAVVVGFMSDDEDEKSSESTADADDTKGADEPDNTKAKRRFWQRKPKSQSTQSSDTKEGSDEKNNSPAPADEIDTEPDYVRSRS